MKNKVNGNNLVSENKSNQLVDFKEYLNLNEYYIKIGYTNNNELIIIIYNTELLNNHRYETKKGLEAALNLHKHFKTNNMSEIYRQLITFINEGKYKIKLNQNDSLTITLNKVIEFNLICRKDNNEYCQVLSNQIKILRHKNNMCNKTIANLQEENAAIKKELNELKNMVMHLTTARKNNVDNKKLHLNNSNSNFQKNRSSDNIHRLNRNIPDEDFMSIGEFNKKCGANIQDENIEELNLINYKLGNDIIDHLSKIKLDKLKLLYLSYNDISDIDNLKNVLLEQVTLLTLSYNKIVDISVLDKVKFDKLQILGLSSNKISDINILEKTKFSQLQNLYLDGNQINNIDVFGKVKFPMLQELNLSSNQISNISVFSKVKFYKLQELFLTNNNISDISVFEKVKFDQLQKLELGGNHIRDINVLEKVKFLKLKKLFLYMNNIIEISVLNQFNFKEMNELNLNDNPIDKKKYGALIEQLKNKIKNFFV